jgi:hypothetical protein
MQHKVADLVQRKPQDGVLVQSEASRAIAEAQSALAIAKRFPRDERTAIERIMNAFTRTALAEKAMYTYARGGSDVTGPSIRAAEVLAQNWGNLHIGVRELEQRAGSPGESVVEAFAWDVETNMKDLKVFTVPHIRETKKGRVLLNDARDIYEHIANQGARRKRACILAVIPGDVIESAMHQAEMTLHTKTQITPETIKSLLDKFKELNVSRTMLEGYIQRSIDAITPALVVRLGKVYNSIKDGMSVPSDWFEAEAQVSEPKQSESRTASLSSILKTQVQSSKQPEPEAPPKVLRPTPPLPVSKEPEAIGEDALNSIRGNVPMIDMVMLAHSARKCGMDEKALRAFIAQVTGKNMLTSGTYNDVLSLVETRLKEMEAD